MPKDPTYTAADVRRMKAQVKNLRSLLAVEKDKARRVEIQNQINGLVTSISGSAN